MRSRSVLTALFVLAFLLTVVRAMEAAEGVRANRFWFFAWVAAPYVAFAITIRFREQAALRIALGFLALECVVTMWRQLSGRSDTAFVSAGFAPPWLFAILILGILLSFSGRGGAAFDRPLWVWGVLLVVTALVAQITPTNHPRPESVWVKSSITLTAIAAGMLLLIASFGRVTQTLAVALAIPLTACVVLAVVVFGHELHGDLQSLRSVPERFGYAREMLALTPKINQIADRNERERVWQAVRRSINEEAIQARAETERLNEKVKKGWFVVTQMSLIGVYLTLLTIALFRARLQPARQREIRPIVAGRPPSGSPYSPS